MLFKSGKRRNEEKRNAQTNGVLSARIGGLKHEVEAVCASQGTDVSEFVRKAVKDALDASPFRVHVLCIGANAAFRSFISAARDAGIVGSEVAEKLGSLLDEFSAQAKSGLKDQFRKVYPESQENDPLSLYPVENFPDLQAGESLMRARMANEELQ